MAPGSSSGPPIAPTASISACGSTWNPAPSPKQIGFAAKLGIKNADRYSRRQLCAIIDKTRVPDWLRRRVGQDGIVLAGDATMRDLATAKRRAGLR
jgi:hypothetical protein